MKRFVLVFLCAVVCCCFLGCTNNTIQIDKESKFSEMMNNLQLPSSKPKVKRSAGVVIYKEETEQKPKQNTSANFGPGDINFDMKMKF